MSIKYRTGQGTSASDFTDLVVKVGDTLPIGAIIGFDTTGTIPNGWEYYAENQIKKISPTTPANGNIENQYGTSQTNAYSEEYSNNTFANKDVATTSANGLMSAEDKVLLNQYSNGQIKLVVTTDCSASFLSQGNTSLHWYRFGTNCTDSPSSTAAGIILSYRDTANWGWQIACYNGILTRRVKSSGTWGAWSNFS